MFFVHLHQILASCGMQIILFFTDTPCNDVLTALKSITLRRNTEL